MPGRTRFLDVLSRAPVIRRLFGDDSSLRPEDGPRDRDYFKELGVRTFINAAGTYTTLTASLMPVQALEAIRYASRHCVSLEELQLRVGDRIARLLGCEGALVTSGAASALTLGTAAVLTGKDGEKISRLPDLHGMKSEVIVQKAHRFSFDHAIRNCGVRLVEVETRDQLARAVTENTAMLFFFNDSSALGDIPDAEFVELGRRYGVPTFNDCAADVPPRENLFRYTRMGFDLVAFSGGKGLRGPQSTGLLLGRKDLIEAAQLNASPNEDTIGRGMKVSKENILGLLAALEVYLQADPETEWQQWERRAEIIRNRASRIPGVEANIFVPSIANHVPHIRVRWDAGAIALTSEQAAEGLRQGEPSIEVKYEEDSLVIGVWMLRPGEAEVVAGRIAEVLHSGKTSVRG